MRTVDPWIIQDPSYSLIYRGHVALDHLVQRLGNLRNLRCGVSKGSEAQSDEICLFEDSLGLFLTVISIMWSAHH
jgi:hypothetical protein